MKNNRLCLGTVQFGMHYGINNKTGKPTRQEVFRMLDVAAENEIEFIDTAAAYGDAEEILGEYFLAGKSKDIFKIISKLRPNLIEQDEKHAEEIVKREVEASLKRLKVERLNGFLLHTPADFYNESVVNGMNKCKEAGLIENWGVSIYEAQDASRAAGSGLIDYIQVPYSVFDQRLNKTDFFEIAKKNQVTVFSRTTFLQGLFAMEIDEVPSHMEEAKAYLKEFQQVTDKHNVSRMEAAFLFSYQNPDIDCLVFGVDNLEQLKEDFRFAAKPSDIDNCLEELRTMFQDISNSVIFPSLWAKK